MNKTQSLISSILLTTSFPFHSALAIDINGDWVGSGSGVQFFCINPNDNVSISSNVDATFNEQTNQQFQIRLAGGNILGDLSGGGALINDSINTALSGTRNNNEPIEYNFSGTFIDDNTLQYGGSGLSNSCSYSFGGILNRVDIAGAGIVPEHSGGSDVIEDAVSLARIVVHSSSVINDRLQHLLIKSKLVKLSSTGFNLNPAISAGDGFDNEMGVWVSYDRSNFKNTFSRTKYKGDTNTFLVGFDYTISDEIVIGAAVAYEKSDIDTAFNQGNVTISGYSFLPYVGYLFNEHWNLNLSGGISHLKYDQYRLAGNTRIDGDTDSKRWFINANINGTWVIDDTWVISGNTGFTTANNNIDRYNESTGAAILGNKSRLTTFTLGGEVAYMMNAFEPYLSLNLNYDNKSTAGRLSGTEQPSSDRSDLLAVIGFRYYGDQGLSMTTELSKRFNRDNLEEYNLSVMARWDF